MKKLLVDGYTTKITSLPEAFSCFLYPSAIDLSSRTLRYLSRTEVQQMLGVNSFGLWRLVRKYDDFPQPTELFAAFGGKKEPEEVWDGFQVYRRAARTLEFASRGAVLLRPLPVDLPPGRWAGYKDTVRGPALDWHTVLGMIRIVHCDDRKVATDVATEVAGGGNPDGVVTVCAVYGDRSFRGPALVAADTAHPGIEYEADWGDVAALTGQNLPWWPALLRLPHLIREWKPGAPAAVRSPWSGRGWTTWSWTGAGPAWRSSRVRPQWQAVARPTAGCPSRCGSGHVHAVER
ncbi:hypothetical protein [Streptomyces achromogenes]|uniref:hypothetical protein n=1 Tax=Streptomyces achromogenes TaxID=67255 RepID=UPI0036F5A664